MLPAACDDARRVHLPYGPHSRQLGDLRVPGEEPPAGGFPVAVLLHGGGWAAPYGIELMSRLAADLVRRGWAAWNVGYRVVGDGGGWPRTFADVAAGVDHVATLHGAGHPLDLGGVVLVGYSAGGTLALWAAGRSDALVRVRAVAAQAPSTDLDGRAHRAAGPGTSASVVALLGGTPEEVPERYEAASPLRRLPLGIPQLLVHGEADTMVPVAMSRSYVEAARAAGDRCALVVRSEDDHLVHIDPGSVAWAAVVDWLAPFGP